MGVEFQKGQTKKKEYLYIRWSYKKVTGNNFLSNLKVKERLNLEHQLNIKLPILLYET